MSVKIKCTIVDMDDWLGIYLDGKLVYEGHSITPGMLLSLLNIPHRRVGVTDEFSEELGGRCPSELSEIDTALVCENYSEGVGSD